MQKYNSITEIFEAFNNLNVLIVGDVMIDAYLWGKVDRISPEAPVPIVAVNKRENRLGGAANVAINIHALGAKPLLCSVVGNDRNGNELIGLMKDLGMKPDGIVQSASRHGRRIWSRLRLCDAEGQRKQRHLYSQRD